VGLLILEEELEAPGEVLLQVLEEQAVQVLSFFATPVMCRSSLAEL
jgi:hypothetical protein